MAKRKRKLARKIKIIIIIVVVIIIGGIIWTIKGSQTNKRKVLNEPLSTDISTQDPSHMTDRYSFEVAGNDQEGLLSRNKQGNPKAGLAKSWGHSKNGLVWTFHLRKHLKWSNGDPLTASNFVYSWRRTVNPKTASEYTYIFSGIKNADAISSGKDKDLNSLGVSAPNKNTVVVTLSHPMAQFENLMSFPVFFAQDKNFVEKQGKGVGTTSSKQVYSGPYKFVGWTGTNKQFKLRPNKYYWNKGAVKNKGVDYRVISDPQALVSAYKRGSLDRADLTIPGQIKKYRQNKNFHQLFNSGTDYIEYNQTGKVPALKNQKIRQALNLATDRKEIAQNGTGGLDIPAKSYTPQGLAKTASGKDFAKTADKSVNYRYNINLAKKLFSQGMSENKQKKLTLTIEASSDDPVSKQTLDILDQDWQKLPGLSIKEKLVPFKQRLQDQRNHNFQVLLGAWAAAYNEPLTFLNMYVTNGSNNDGKWSNLKYNRLIQKASSADALNDKRRTQDEVGAEKLLYEKSAINPILWTRVDELQNPKVKGFKYFSSGPPYYYWPAKVNP